MHFLRTCQGHRKRLEDDGEDPPRQGNHIMDVMAKDPALIKLSEIPAALLQAPEGNVESRYHSEGSILNKKRFMEFALGMNKLYTTSNDDKGLHYLGDSGGSITQELEKIADHYRLPINNLAMLGLLKAEIPELSMATVSVQPDWGVVEMVQYLEDTFGVEALSIRNNPDLAHLTLIVDIGLNCMRNAKDKKRFFPSIPDHLRPLYEKLCGIYLRVSQACGYGTW